MKKYSLLALCALFMACQQNATGDEKTPSFPQTETFEYPVKEDVVYGVSIKDYQPEAIYRGYAVQLSLNDKTWIDSVYIELSGTDTLTTEVIFMEALVDDQAELEYSVTPFDAG